MVLSKDYNIYFANLVANWIVWRRTSCQLILDRESKVFTLDKKVCLVRKTRPAEWLLSGGGLCRKRPKSLMSVAPPSAWCRPPNQKSCREKPRESSPCQSCAFSQQYFTRAIWQIILTMFSFIEEVFWEVVKAEPACLSDWCLWVCLLQPEVCESFTFLSLSDYSGTK